MRASLLAILTLVLAVVPACGGGSGGGNNNTPPPPMELLDQSVVIRGLWPLRRADGRLTLRRTYHFEFTSTGDQRYRGILVLIGMQLRSIELEAFKLPPAD